ncbi:MAG: hypothetical protein HKN76_14445, partial [Saprospiraceae bacterium]|nr:hypothetical protein [Saprospiraceae bacterium]
MLRHKFNFPKTGNNHNKNRKSKFPKQHLSPYIIFLSLIFMGGISLASKKHRVYSTVPSLSTAAPPSSGEAQIYLGFETSAEPYETMPPREPDPNGTGNGCMGGESWNEFYKFNVCVSPTSPLSDYALERSSQYARHGGSSLRCFLRPTDIADWPLGEATHRAELAPHHSS